LQVAWICCIGQCGLVETKELTRIAHVQSKGMLDPREAGAV
jgi:hypothetical protein